MFFLFHSIGKVTYTLFEVYVSYKPTYNVELASYLKQNKTQP